MPRYEVRSLDVWGNAVDGYEVNSSSLEGEIVLPAYEHELSTDFINRMIAGGFLSKNALEMARAGEIGIEDDFESMVLTEQEVAWAAVTDDQGTRYLDANTRAEAERQILSGEEVQQVEGMRPVLQLTVIDGRPDTVPFLRKAIGVGTKLRGQPEPDTATLELRIDPDSPTERPMTGFTKRITGEADFLVDSYVDGDFFGTFILRDIDGELLGISKGGHDVVGDEDLISQARVALDLFFELGGEPAGQFVPSKESLLPDEAKRLLEQIRQNADDYSKKRISQEDFNTKSRKLWDRARQLGYATELAELVAPMNRNITTTSSHRSAAAARLQVGDHVRFATPAHHDISNFDIDISGMTGTVRQVDRENLWIELDSLRYERELREWDNALHFELSEGHYPELETVQEELAKRDLPYKPCGLNADWSVQAWMLSNGAPNRVDGAYYLLDAEDDEGNYAIVRRFLEELEEDGRWIDNPRYVEEDQGIETVISDGPLTQVLDEYMGIADRD